MPIRMTTMAITIISSTSVNPNSRRLPLRIRYAIGVFFGTLGKDIEHILAAPSAALGIVLHAARAPVRRVRHGIDRDAPQKLDLYVRGLAHAFHAINEVLKLERI